MIRGTKLTLFISILATVLMLASSARAQNPAWFNGYTGHGDFRTLKIGRQGW